MLVKLCQRDLVVGALEFFVIPVPAVDRSSWVEFEVDNQPWVRQVRVVPASIATRPEIRAIADSLFRNETTGKAGRFEWRLVAQEIS